MLTAALGGSPTSAPHCTGRVTSGESGGPEASIRRGESRCLGQVATHQNLVASELRTRAINADQSLGWVSILVEDLLRVRDAISQYAA